MCWRKPPAFLEPSVQSAASTLQHPQTGSQFDPNRKHPRNQFQRLAFALWCVVTPVNPAFRLICIQRGPDCLVPVPPRVNDVLPDL